MLSSYDFAATEETVNRGLMLLQRTFTVETPGRGMIDVTTTITDIISHAEIETGLCNIFLHHTSASLLICENADISVQQDLERFMQKLAPDGDSLFQHIAEGPDDMPSHIRTVLTQSSVIVPIIQSRLGLGTWQGIYLWEHRLQPHNRNVTVTLYGN